MTDYLKLNIYTFYNMGGLDIVSFRGTEILKMVQIWNVFPHNFCKDRHSSQKPSTGGHYLHSALVQRLWPLNDLLDGSKLDKCSNSKIFNIEGA